MNNQKLQSVLTRAMALCSRSEKSSFEIRNKLADWGVYKFEQVEWVISRLSEEKFIDDKRYAIYYASDKHSLNKWGKVKIRQMLRSKGIDDSLIGEALETIDTEVYETTIRKELENKKKNIKAKNQFDLKGKLFRFGISKGYETDLIYRVIDEIT